MTVSGDNAIVYVGDKYTLMCSHDNSSSLALYQWMQNNVTIANATGPTLWFSSLKLSDAGQ